MSRGRVILPAAVLAVVTAATVTAMWPVLSNGFLNWDDPDVLVGNARLHQPGLVAWAFTTTHMGHYQPLAWITWAMSTGVPPAADRAHALSLSLHVLNAALLFSVCRQFAAGRTSRGPAYWPALVAALIFAVHPLRVEPVAWASAFPYLLSYALLLACVSCWTVWCRHGARGWLWSATALFALSQLARVTVPLMPLVLGTIAATIDAPETRTPRRILFALAPMAAIAIGLSVVEVNARSVEDLATVGLAARAAALLGNPGLYLWRTLVPVGLTPLDPVPLTASIRWAAVAAQLAGFGVAVALTWRMASARAALVVWGSYVLLLLPVIGLTPSGLQATADRYTYGPAMVLSVALAVGLATIPARWRRSLLMVGAVAVVALAGAARVQAGYWRDSVTLWSRAVALDPSNDVALYNRALALADARRTDEAIEDYQRLLTLVPDHDLGRRALATQLADREQRSGDLLATAGRFKEAIPAYDRVLVQDPTRVRVRASRGMARLSLGDVPNAIPDLEAALAGGVDEVAVVNGLSYAWMSVGRAGDALRLLSESERRHPDDVGIVTNLSRLLVTVDAPALRDPQRALALAQRANARTADRDPRVLDTLALALAATGDRARAAATLDRAIMRAQESGDGGLAAELAQRRSRLPR